MFLLAVIPAKAQGLLLLPGASVKGPVKTDKGEVVSISLTLDKPKFLVEREDINHYNLLEKDLRRCQNDLFVCNTRLCLCPESEGKDPPVLEGIGWPGVVLSCVLVATGAFLGGVFFGTRVVR